MSTDVKNTEVNLFVTSKEKKIVVSKDEVLEIIWEKKITSPARRFTTADLWNIRRNARSFKVYRKLFIR
jgi:hypothetical protein